MKAACEPEVVEVKVIESPKREPEIVELIELPERRWNVKVGQKILCVVHRNHLGHRVSTKILKARRAHNGMLGIEERWPVGYYADADLDDENEGIVWCRGWTGKHADAFRVSCALRTP